MKRDIYLDTYIIKDEGVISVGVDTQPVCELTLNLRVRPDQITPKTHGEFF